jgi:protein TonB
METDAVISAETMPQFPGGQTALIRFIYENIQYPPVALKQRIEGRVWCSFIVEADGSISNIRLEESVYIFLDEEAVRVLKKMPAWSPGRTKGENVRVKIYIPIVFKR